MKIPRSILGIGLAVAVLECPCAALAGTAPPPARASIPYVATRHDAVRDMLWMANVGKDDVVYDLGSGDGRIVIAATRDFGAQRAVGIETDPELVRRSRENAEAAGVSNRVEFIQGDLFRNDFRQATVLTAFLGHAPNITLRPQIFRTLQPGTRVVSHQFGMGEWQTDKSLTVRTAYFGMWSESWSRYHDNQHVPSYAGNESHFGKSDRLLMWVVPAPVAGVWRGTLDTADGVQSVKVILHQRLSTVTGTCQIGESTFRLGGHDVDIWGDHLRFWAGRLRFDGHVRNDTMRGTLSLGDLSQARARSSTIRGRDGGQPRTLDWQAQRDKTDFRGTWEWTSLVDTRTVRLRIESLDGTYAATYMDSDRSIPITQFYDHEGGLYFALLIGVDINGSLEISEVTGWLVGEGVVEDGSLKGRIEFYPAGQSQSQGFSDIFSDEPGADEPLPPIRRDWTPRLVRDDEATE